VQVVSAGALGPLGRNGLYCRDIDVDRFPAIAGWRGLNDSAVREYFNSTLHAFVREWGPLEELVQNLGPGYKVLFLGSEADVTIRSRLQAGVPTLFYLWSPHSLNAGFDLNRIQLPPYTTPASFEQGRSDYPTDVLEKVASKKLAEIAPDVATLYARFTIETATQEQLMLGIDQGSQTVMQAVCGWLKGEENLAVWHLWLRSDHSDQPTADRPMCSDSELIVDVDAMRLDHLAALRESIVMSSPECRTCILATATSVFGDRLVAERLQLVVDEPRRTFPTSTCPAALASRMTSVASILAAAQAAVLSSAVHSLEPFGLSIAVPGNSEPNSTATVLVHDLFVPTDDVTVYDQPVMYGIDTNRSMLACSREEHLDTWVIAPSGGRSASDRCEGDVWIDRLSGKGQLAATASNGAFAPTVMIMIQGGLGKACGSMLRSAVLPGVDGGTLAFPTTTSADEVACWLARLVGPQSAIPSAKAPTSIELPQGLGPVRLLTDVVLPPGRSLLVKGANNTLIVGSYQVRVGHGALLALESITVANSVRSTAIAIEAGSVRLSNSTVRNCSVYMNALNVDGLLESRGGALSANAGGRLELDSVDLHANSAAEGEAASSGGAIYCTAGSSIHVTGSKLRENVARRAGLAARDLKGIAQGGAIFLSASFLFILDSELSKNAARDGGFIAQGGAVYGRDGSSLTVRDSKLYGNLVENGGLLFTAKDNEDAGSYGGAVYLELDSSAEIIDSEICDNMARAGAQWTDGGAVMVEDGCSLVIAGSKLLRNAVHGGGDGVDAGAVYVIGGDKPSVAWLSASEFCDNRATAMDGGVKSSSGAVCVQQAQLTVVDCKLHRNVASGGDRAFGGAFFFYTGSRVLMQRSDVSDNEASGGALCSHGGGIYADIGGSGELQIESTHLGQNCANSSAALAAGGGLYLKSGSATIIDSDLSDNAAFGQMAYGGAVYAIGTILTVRTGIRKNTILSIGVEGEAFGGGMFNGGAMMRLVDSHLFGNVASIASPAVQASAGAMYNALGARTVLDGCVLRSNTAGGRGLLQAASFAYDNDRRAEYEASMAAHIFTAGRAEINHTTIIGTSDFAPIEYPAQRWIVVGGGTLYLGGGNFSATAESDRELWLLASSKPDAEIFLRQCTVRNLKLQSAAKVAVVNSEFEPPLNSSLFATFQRGECARVVANEQMCDPRALCELRQVGGVSSGVQCSCVGNGLRNTPGVTEDGQQCTQDPSMRAVLESESVSITVAKPGSLTNRTLTLIAEAHGEAELAVAFSVTMALFEASSGAVIATNGSIRIDQPSISAFGHHVEWKQQPPAATWHVDLDATRIKFADSSRHEFTVRLACDRGEQNCAADGDVITTVIQLATVGSALSNRQSEVRILTQVQSLPSCEHTRDTIRIEPEAQSVPVATPIRVQLSLNDVDGLPVNFTRAEIILSFGGRNVPMQWSRGSNQYVANVPAEFTQQPGLYDLVMRASHAWGGAEQVASCELLRRTITIEAGLDTTWILLGAGAAAIIIVAGLVIVVRKRHAHLQAILTMLLTEMGMLVLTVFAALTNLVTDGIVFGRLLRGELNVSSKVYTAACATIMCFGVVATALSLGYRIRNARLIRSQLQQLAPQGQSIAVSMLRCQAQQHEWELVQTHRTKVTLSLSLTSVVAQGGHLSEA
jgi:hypothetical protein